jgi:hypothetical protein
LTGFGRETSGNAAKVKEAGAFSSEAGTGSREEIASKQQPGAGL